MSATTRMGAAQDALFAMIGVALAANPTYANVARSLGWPGKDLERDHVWVDGNVEVRDSEFEATSDGLDGDDEETETFILRVFVRVRFDGGTFAQARDRALTIGAVAVEAPVRADRSLLGAVVRETLVRRAALHHGDSDTGRVVQLDYEVGCVADLR